jgi:hypothetical protein
METELKTEERVSVYAPKAEHGGYYLSVEQIKKHNEDIGHHFFSAETMRFFSSKTYTDLHLGRYFITSEQDKYGDQGRRYTLRRADGQGGIDTWGEFCGYSSLRSARTALKKIGLKS